jgi:hypothetical protein
MKPLERVLVQLSPGKFITGHYLSDNSHGDPLIAYHDHPTGESWGRHATYEVTASGEACTCESARDRG